MTWMPVWHGNLTHTRRWILTTDAPDYVKARRRSHGHCNRYTETRGRDAPDGLPFSAACERNKGPILEHLRRHFASAVDVLEIGSGTGQHAVYFAAHLPHLRWQASERAENLAALTARLA